MTRMLTNHSFFKWISLTCIACGLMFAVACNDSGDGDVDGDTDTDGDSEEGLALDPIEYVNPFIATGGEGFNIGSGLPGATRPFGMVKLSPDTEDAHGATDFYHCSGYYYPDDRIVGFSHLHLYGTGATDYGNLLFMPMTEVSDDRTLPKNYRTTFKKENESASPGYYRVTMDNDITAELTATERCGIHRYTYPDNSDAYVLIDLSWMISGGSVDDSQLTIDAGANEVYGWHHAKGGLSGRIGGVKVYFVARFDAPIDQYGTWDATQSLQADQDTCTGAECGAYLKFKASTVNVQVGISFVDAAGARNNLETEVGDNDFDTLRQQAENAWRDELSVLKLNAVGSHLQDEAAMHQQLVLTYTALYHAMMMPDIFSDADGRYLGFDDEIHTAEGFTYYTDFSLWDTFRTEHPLLTLIKADRQKDMAQSLIKMMEQGGYAPRWPIANGYTGCMIGTHADVVLADSYLKDIPMENPEAVFEGLLQTAVGPTAEGSAFGGRRGIQSYLDLGYVADEASGGSASRTMEFAYDDYALYMMASRLGRSEADMLLEHSRNYKNLWNGQEKFFIARKENGDFVREGDDFDPTSWYDFYTEAAAYQYLFHAPHDPEGMMELMGGREAFLARLEELFRLSADWETEYAGGAEQLLPRMYYWHGNEPDIHTTAFFGAADRPDLSCKWNRWIMRNFYHNDPDGIPGNDDCGTLSSWYLLASFGFFPMAGTQRYYLSCPMFADMEIPIQGNTLHITAEGPLDDNAVPESILLNGTALERGWFEWDDIKNGGELHFVMRAAQSGE